MTTREFFAAVIPAAKPTQRDPDREPANPLRPGRPFAAAIEHATPGPAPDKSHKSDKSAPAALPANVIPFPGSAVVVPFPQPPVPEASETTAGPTPWAKAELEEVEIDVPWPMTPESGKSTPGSNIEAIDFRARPTGEVIPVEFNSGAATSAAAVSDAGTPPHLPGAGGEGENSAHLEGVPQNSAGKKGRSAGAISAEASLGGHGDGGRIAHGITAAPDVSVMDSEQDLERRRGLLERPPKTEHEPDTVAANESEGQERPHEFSARSLGAMDWQMGRPVGLPDRPAPAALPSAGGLSQTGATLDWLSQLMLRESTLIRQHGSAAMSVVLRPDAETELYVHFSQQNGQLCAAVRCERGDFQHLNQLWPQLQETLAHQKIALAPLQESSSANSHEHAPFAADLDGFHQRQDPSDAGRQSWAPDEPSTERERNPSAAQTEEPSGSVRGRRGTRPAPSNRPGWETWA